MCRVGSRGSLILSLCLAGRGGQARAFVANMASSGGSGTPKRVCVIGAGAAGLASSKALRDVGLSVTCFEGDEHVGGVWRYKEADGPMYRSLRTNLPKELMAFRGDPFPARVNSFPTHGEVYEYLRDYAVTHDLGPLIRFGSRVLNVAKRSDGSVWTVRWQRSEAAFAADEPQGRRRGGGGGGDSAGGSIFDEDFDAVVVCNGHYDVPSMPGIAGLASYTGKLEHSLTYDEPSPYRRQRVLCIGARSSGTDIAREIAEFHHHEVEGGGGGGGREASEVEPAVHVVDKGCHESVLGGTRGRVWRRPDIEAFEGGKGVRFQDGSRAEVDTVIYCTGYEYDFAFLKHHLQEGQRVEEHQQDEEELKEEAAAVAKREETSNSSSSSRSSSSSSSSKAGTDETDRILVRAENRSVSPLFLDLFHVQDPTLCFIGLLHSVVPFPQFDIQARLAAAVYSGQVSLPSEEARREAFEADKRSLRERGGREKDAHYQGGMQWEYNRKLAKIGGFWNDAFERQLQLWEALYNHAGTTRPKFPGGPDSYRDNQYIIDEQQGTFEVVSGGSRDDTGKVIVQGQGHPQAAQATDEAEGTAGG